MDNRDRKNIDKIIEHAQSIISETKDIKNADEFKDNNTKSKSALFDLLQIGELTKNLSNTLINETPNIPWINIYNLRNGIVHGYADVDYEIIWETIKYNIPELVSELKKAIK